MRGYSLKVLLLHISNYDPGVRAYALLVFCTSRYVHVEGQGSVNIHSSMFGVCATSR